MLEIIKHLIDHANDKDEVKALLGDDRTLAVRNQNHACAIWLDLSRGDASDRAGLQHFIELTCGGAKADGGTVSPKAASQRVCMQRSHQDGYGGRTQYPVAEQDRTAYQIVGAGGRTGTVLKATEGEGEAIDALFAA